MCKLECQKKQLKMEENRNTRSKWLRGVKRIYNMVADDDHIDEEKNTQLCSDNNTENNIDVFEMADQNLTKKTVQDFRR